MAWLDELNLINLSKAPYLAAGGEVSTHSRYGHSSMHPHGPRNSLRKVMFIAPTWGRPNKLAASL